MKTITINEKNGNAPRTVSVLKKWELNAYARANHAGRILGRRKPGFSGAGFPVHITPDIAADNYDLQDLKLDAQKLLYYGTGNWPAAAATEITKATKQTIEATSGKKLSSAEVNQMLSQSVASTAGVTKQSIEDHIVKPVTGFFTNIFSSLKWVLIIAAVIAAVILLSKTKAILS